MICNRARHLFGACWDDELTQAERDWLEAHFASCARCRSEYEEFSRALEVTSALPRIEASADLVERIVARTRRSATVPDAVAVAGIRWAPAAVAAAAAVFVIAALIIIPRTLWQAPGSGGAPQVAFGPTRPATPLPVLRSEARNEGLASSVRLPQRRSAMASGTVAIIPDSLFDHNEDVEFILDPITLHRGRASVTRTGSRLPRVEGAQAIITF